jgi:hypothetical protein
MPVALIVGKLDRTAIGKERAPEETAKQLGNYPLLAKKTAAEIKHCLLLDMEGIGHVPHVENFQLFTQKLDLALAGNRY